VVEVKEALEAIGTQNIDPTIFERLIAQEGQTLSCPGAKADSLYLIQSGSVEVFDGLPAGESESDRKVLGPGHFVGEMGFERNAITQLTIRALEKTHLLRIDASGLARRLEERCGGRGLQLKKLMGLGERLIFVS
jgi:CRP-like cAMP-binding protein